MQVAGFCSRPAVTSFGRAERVVEGSGLPWTTLRATQFHDLILMLVRALAKLPVIPVPTGVSFQPVDADEVAARLVELALGEASGLVPDVAGPRVYPTTYLIRAYLEATRRRKRSRWRALWTTRRSPFDEPHGDRSEVR